MTTKRTATVAGGELDRILRERRLRTLFQPIVHLESGAAVGYEALVRGPEGSPLATADSLLEAAYSAGRVVELDWVARASACRAALAARLDPEQLLFLNVEPLALDSECPPDLWPDIERAFGMFRIVLEVTERTLDRDPGKLLDGLDRVRPTVVGFALDDVGSAVATLAMLSLVGPAVIKLDRRIVQGDLDDESVQVLTMAYEEAERTGAILLNEGIETANHEALARSLGGTLGQGYFFGHPSPQPVPARGLTEPMRMHAEAPASVSTPFDALHGYVNGRAGSSLLTTISRNLLPCVADLTAPALLICLLPDPVLFGPDERRRLSDLARQGVLTAVLGPGLPAHIGDGIRGAGARGEPDITNEWATVVLSSCSAGAVLARADDKSPTEFEFGMTHNPARVLAAARCLFRRLGRPEPRAGGRPS
jgi:EAL domain-containing protein (putative c-di-GMP-specific phosphodiesterase class I)